MLEKMLLLCTFYMNNRAIKVNMFPSRINATAVIDLRALSTLRGLRGAPEVPPLCRETQSLGQQMLKAPLDDIVDIHF